MGTTTSFFNYDITGIGPPSRYTNGQYYATSNLYIIIAGPTAPLPASVSQEHINNDIERLKGGYSKIFWKYQNYLHKIVIKNQDIDVIHKRDNLGIDRVFYTIHSNCPANPLYPSLIRNSGSLPGGISGGLTTETETCKIVRLYKVGDF